MVTTLPRPKPGKAKPQSVEKIPGPRNDRPWHKYRKDPRYKLLEPGWAGQIDDDELGYIQQMLKADDALSAWWGFRPRAKRRPVEAIKRVAMYGDPDNQTENRSLARMRPERPFPAIKRPVSRSKK